MRNAKPSELKYIWDRADFEWQGAEPSESECDAVLSWLAFLVQYPSEEALEGDNYGYLLAAQHIITEKGLDHCTQPRADNHNRHVVM